MMPLSNVVRVREATAPKTITHYNMFRSAEINGSAAPGYSSGQAIQLMEQLSNRVLPQGMTFAWSGLSLEEIKAGRQAVLIFGLGLLLVYLTLAGQYESVTLPFIILLVGAARHPRRAAGAVGARTDRRRLLPDWPRHAHRPVGEERHSRRAVRRGAARSRDEHRRRRGRSRAHPAAADSDDVARVHPRRDAARGRERRGPRGAALGRHRRGGRHDCVDVLEPRVHPRALCRRQEHRSDRRHEATRGAGG